MDRLTTDQAGKVHDALGPAHGYLNRLINRLQATGLRYRDMEPYYLAGATGSTAFPLRTAGRPQVLADPSGRVHRYEVARRQFRPDGQLSEFAVGGIRRRDLKGVRRTHTSLA